jgi:large subunit ribosomal protein L25
MEALELVAQVREEKGKGHAAKLRRDGLLPCVLYGSEIDAVPMSVKTAELDRIIKEGGPNALIKVKLNANEYITLVREIQSHPVTKEYLHADLQRISMKEKLQTLVPLRIVGEAPGVNKGGILDQMHREVEVECQPTDIPEYIEVDISSLGFGESLTVAELSVGSGVEIITDPDAVVVSVVAPAEEPAEEAEGEAEPARVGEEGAE